MQQGLALDISFKSIFRFTFPSIVLMVFTSLYVMVDGIFVARLISTDALSALNIIYPLVNIFMAIGIMMATGGSAICAIKLGQAKDYEARQDFSSFLIAATILSVIIAYLLWLNIEALIYALGSNQQIYQLCYDYAWPMLFFGPVFVMQVILQFFCITAGRPALAVIITLIGGLSNIVLDYLLIATFNLGILGAALATGLGALFSVIYGLIWFIWGKNNSLRLTKPNFKLITMAKAAINGSSEMVSNIATAITTYLFNITMMNLVGSAGVAAITIVLYAQFLLTAIYLGYANGVAPLISFNYGEQNKPKLQALIKISLKFIMMSSIIISICSLIFAPSIAAIFADNATEVSNIAVPGLRIFTIGFLFSGLNIFCSSMFTAFANGKVSAFISFLRTFLFIGGAILILPQILDITGVWLAVPIAEALTVIISIILLKRYRKVYQY